MFMIPTPPTTSEMAATTKSKAPINSDACANVGDLRHVLDLEVVVFVLSQMVPLAEHRRGFLDGHRHLLRAGGLARMKSMLI